MFNQIIKPRTICAKNKSIALSQNTEVNGHKVHNCLSKRLQPNFLGLGLIYSAAE